MRTAHVLAQMPTTHEDHPRPVAEEITQVAPSVVFCVCGELDALARHGERAEEEHRRCRAVESHRVTVAELGAAPAEMLDEPNGAGLDDEVAGESAQEPIGRQPRALERVGCDDAHEGAVRDVDGCVDQHHRAVGGIGVDELGPGGKVRPVEGRETDDAEGHGQPQEVGPELAPSCLGPVPDHPHAHIGDEVDEPHDTHHRSRSRGADADDVGVEVEQEDGERLPEQARREVSEAVADSLREPETRRVSHGFRSLHWGTKARTNGVRLFS